MDRRPRYLGRRRQRRSSGESGRDDQRAISLGFGASKDLLAGTGTAMAYPVLSTYRLQLRGASAGDAFTFADAEKFLDYFSRLGVSHLYLSPILTAAPGSTHGYDVTDPTTVSEELGGADGLARLAEAAEARGLGL